MEHFYFDSSALVKRYVAESGTDWMNQLCAAEARNTLYTVRISGAEIIAALFRRARTGELAVPDVQAAATKFKDDFHKRYQIVEVKEQLIQTAMILAERHALRVYDAVKLAAALELKATRDSLALSPIHFVCADHKLNEAAAEEGLTPENPNAH